MTSSQVPNQKDSFFRPHMTCPLWLLPLKNSAPSVSPGTCRCVDSPSPWCSLVFWPWPHSLLRPQLSPWPSLRSHSFNRLRACGSANSLQIRPPHWAWESEIHLPSASLQSAQTHFSSSAPCASKCHHYVPSLSARNHGASLVFFCSLIPHNQITSLCIFYFFKKSMWTILKVFIDFVTILFCFMFWFFGW